MIYRIVRLSTSCFTRDHMLTLLVGGRFLSFASIFDYGVNLGGMTSALSCRALIIPSVKQRSSKA